MRILYFVLVSSEEKKKGRNTFRAVNANFFDQKFEIKRNYGNEEGIRWEPTTHPSRKMFRGLVQELLEEKLLVRIHTSDDRAKWYSITPLGICSLIKSREFTDVERRPYETSRIVSTLLTFAIPKVKQYDSLIFEKEKFFDRNKNFVEELNNTDMPRSGNMANVFSNIDFENNEFSFYVINGYQEENKLVLSRGIFNPIRFDKNMNPSEPNLIQIVELNKKIKQIPSDAFDDPLWLDEEQFHHYFANLLLCSLIYRYAIVTFDLDRLTHFRSTSKDKKIKKTKIKEHSDYWKHLPEYFQRAIALFSKHFTKIVNEQANLMADFSLTLR